MIVKISCTMFNVDSMNLYLSSGSCQEVKISSELLSLLSHMSDFAQCKNYFLLYTSALEDFIMLI